MSEFSADELTVLHHLNTCCRTMPLDLVRPEIRDAAYALTRLGYVEVTWAARARLTATGRELFEVCGVGA